MGYPKKCPACNSSKVEKNDKIGFHCKACGSRALRKIPETHHDFVTY
jgi:transcription elongation factor Elf1